MVAYYKNRINAVGCGLRLLALVLFGSATYLLLRFGLQMLAVFPLMLAVLVVWLRFWLPGNPDRNMPAPGIRRDGTLRLALSRNRGCNFCNEGKRPLSLWQQFTKLLKLPVGKSRSVYVIGGLSDHWICDCCLREALQVLSNPKRQLPLQAKKCCSFCGDERSTRDAITKGQARVCADCLRDIDFVFENPIVPPG